MNQHNDQTKKRDIRLVLVETSGNQAYIFGTNKMRDIIGASELTFRAGTIFVQEAINRVFHRDESSPSSTWSYKAFAKGPENEAAIGDGKLYEVLLATSGKALLLVDGADKARDFITAWSQIAMEHAPGMDAMGVFSEIPVDPRAGKEEPGSIHLAMKHVHELFEQARVRRTAPQARFQTLPVIRPCEYSGLPANDWASEGNNAKPASAMSLKKIVAREGFYPRLIGDLEAELPQLKVENIAFAFKKELEALFRSPDVLEKALENCEWLAVIHADGNGLGQVFLNFGDHVEKLRDKTKEFGREYIKLYREISFDLDQITRRAFLEAFEAAGTTLIKRKEKKYFPVVPIVLGGDDLTIMMDGAQALDFTRTFLNRFISECEEKDSVKSVAEVVLNKAKNFGMAAGVSITKPHFPFFTSYSFAEELIKSAKRAKKLVNQASTAMDWHILYDSSCASIADIRRKMIDDDKTMLRTGKPYVVDIIGDASDKEWLGHHKWQRFEAAVTALKAEKEKEKRKLPNSQSHAVREWLFREDMGTMEEEWKQMVERYGLVSQWEATSPDKSASSLFNSAPDHLSDSYLLPEERNSDYAPPKIASTVFLDALEAMEFTDIGSMGRGRK